MNDQAAASLLRRSRLWLANVPLVSMVAFRWFVRRGSIIYDVALTRRAALRRRPNEKATVSRAR